jgi:hypothetical protein
MFVLATGTTVKIRLSSDTDYQIIQKIVEDTVTVTPNGGDPLVVDALDGVDTNISQPIKSFTCKGTVWLAPNDITLYRAALGEPVVTGTNPYVHTFTGGSVGQAIDFFVEGPKYGDSTKYVRFTGTNGAVKLTDLGIFTKGGAAKFGFEITAGSDTCQVIVGAASNLT